MGVAPYLSAFGLGFLGTLLVTPGVKRLAAWAGAMDRPNARKVHKVPTPLWGGLGVFAAYVFAVATVLAIFPEARDARGASQLLGVFIGSCMIVAIGMIDDRFNMAAKVKLVGQLATAGAMFHFGVRIDYMSLPFFGFFYLTDLQSLALTTFWIVGITNAVNLLDGLDGLVAGVALGSSLVFLVVSAVNGQWMVVLVMAALAGCTLGFLRYNFNPATIFMGDTGSLLIGLNFAGWSVVGVLKTTVSLALAVPLLIMAVPILDTAFAIVRRTISGRPIFSPDKGHLHHRLLATGLSQKQAVCIIYAINMTFGLAGLALAYANR